MYHRQSSGPLGGYDFNDENDDDPFGSLREEIRRIGDRIDDIKEDSDRDAAEKYIKTICRPYHAMHLIIYLSKEFIEYHSMYLCSFCKNFFLRNQKKFHFD